MADKNTLRKNPKKTSQTTNRKTVHNVFEVKRRVGSQLSSYLSRRPHRSFRRTRRRDYVRSLDLPGYWSFTAYVLKIMRANGKLLMLVALTYAILGALFVGLSSQGSYSQLSQLLDDSGSDIFGGGWGTIGQAGLLLLTGLSGNLNPQFTDAQQIYSALILLLTWLTTVWLLRGILAGKNPRLRDGLYNAGAPIVATAIVLLVALLQLLPATLGIIVFSSAVTTNLFESGFITMIVTLAVGALIILSLYWIVSTLIALIVVTLPGMYPWQAIRTAGDIVVGRRMRLLLRVMWMMAANVLVWVAVVLPVIIIDRFLKSVVPVIENVPVVPVAIALISSIVVVWSATYMYLLYRKVVEDDAKPA